MWFPTFSLSFPLPPRSFVVHMPLAVHRPSYTPQQLHDVLTYNKYVQVYLWVGLIGIVGITTLFHILGQSLSYLRRRYAASYIGRTRPSGACSRSGKGCTKWVPGTMLATFRKACCRKSHAAEKIGMSSLGEVFLVVSYYCLNIILVVCGGESTFLAWFFQTAS